MDAEKLQRLVTTEMPYGKHKGTLLADLPGNYLHWFAREGFPKGELGQLLALMHEIDHNGLSDLLRPLRALRGLHHCKNWGVPLVAGDHNERRQTNNHTEGMHMKGNIAAIVLVVLVVFFLLTNLGLISISLRELLRVWWPVALIAVGVALFFTPGNKSK